MSDHAQPNDDIRKKCAACGISPINHRLAFFMSTVDGTFGALVSSLSRRLPLPSTGPLLNGFLHTQIGFLRLIRMGRMGTDPEKAATGRSKLIWEEAIRRSIPMEQLIIWGKPIEQYRARIGSKWMYFESLPIPSKLPQSAYLWLDDKFALKQKLESAGIPTPRVRTASSWQETRRAFAELTKPVIIKPRFGSRGRHTTTNIQTEEQLHEAYKLARMITPFIVVEEHLEGSVCRATVIDGKLVGFFRADPPFVTGDGVHTVQELIQQKNLAHGESLGDILADNDLLSFIARQGKTLESVLPHNQHLNLSAKTGRLYGGRTREMLSEIHPKLRAVFESITEHVPAPVLGFDLIIADPTADPDGERWGIIECNSLPFIDLHYFAFEGPRNDLAPHVWDLWKKEK